MWKPKYIAEGFEGDAARILKEFVEKSSVEFLEFAEIWKKHHFSLIFMGRPDQIETSEFTNEVFRITMHSLSSPSFYQRVGTVYLLYALFRNQITDPPVKIRLDSTQWTRVKSLHRDAKFHQYRTLHYVIDYLIKNAFMYVANETLKGPLIGSMQKSSKSSEMLSTMKATYKSDIIEYSLQSNLKALRDLHSEYLEIKKGFDSQVKVTLSNDYEVYDGLISELDKLVNPSQRNKKEGSESLGSRRAKIKAESFLRKTMDRFGQAIEEDDCETDQNPDNREVVTKKKGARNRRTPKHKRKAGRPSKKPKIEIPEDEKSDDDNIDISHLINQQNDFYLPPEEEGKKLKCKPGRYYYKLSPKHEDSDSSGPVK